MFLSKIYHNFAGNRGLQDEIEVYRRWGARAKEDPSSTLRISNDLKKDLLSSRLRNDISQENDDS